MTGRSHAWGFYLDAIDRLGVESGLSASQYPAQSLEVLPVAKLKRELPLGDLISSASTAGSAFCCFLVLRRSQHVADAYERLGLMRCSITAMSENGFELPLDADPVRFTLV